MKKTLDKPIPQALGNLQDRHTKASTKKRDIIPKGKYQALIIKPRWDNEIIIQKLADDLFEHFKNPENLWLQDFFIERMITREQIVNIRNRSKYFAEIYSLCKDIQESRLFHAGLDSRVNNQFLIFSMKNVCKWRSEPTEDNTRDYQIIGFEFVEAIDEPPTNTNPKEGKA